MNKEKIFSENLDNSLKLLAKSSLIVLFGLIISKILGYTYRIIIARYYGPEVYGLFMLALTIASFFISIAAFGFSEGLLRYIPVLRAKNKKDEIKYLVRQITKYYLIAGLISAILLFLVSDFISLRIFQNTNLPLLLKIMGIYIFTSLLINLYLGSLRGFEQINSYSFISNIFQNIFRVGILSILIFIGIKSDSIVVWSWVLASFLTFVISYLACRYKIMEIFGEYKKQDYSKLRKEFISYSWPIAFYSIIGLMLYWIDTFSLGFYKSAVEVGLYNSAVPIAMLISIIPEIFMQLFFPMINREYSNKNYQLIEQLSKQVTKWIFMAALPIFILIFFFPGAALNILFGAEYLPAETALRLLLIGAFFSALFVVSNNLISMLGKSKLILVNMSLAALLNLTLNSLLVPSNLIFGLDNSNGLIGAATATLISITFLNFIFLIQTKRYLSFMPLRRKIVMITLISIIPTLLLLYAVNNLTLTLFTIIILAVLFIFIYGILILISKSLDENDWMLIKSILRKVEFI